MQNLLTAIDHLYEIAAIAAVLVVCGTALAFGDKRLRLAGLVQLSDVFVIAAVSTVLDPNDQLGLLHYKALLVLFVYIFMTLRWSDRYLIILAGLQGFAVLIHFSDLIDPGVQWPVNRLLLNLTGWSMLAVLAIALGSRVIRHLDRRQAARLRTAGLGPHRAA